MLTLNIWWLHFLGLLLPVIARREDYENIGYFWHITDIHYDHHNIHGENKRGCGRPDNSANSNYGNTGMGKTHWPRNVNPSGLFGGYGCDSGWDLIESAAKFMKSKQNDNIEFVLWTGDSLSHNTKHETSEASQLELIQKITDLLGKTFPNQFVFPVLGHDDPLSRKHLGRMWSKWLPPDSAKTFELGGFYIFERKLLKLQIVVLNTGLMRRGEKDEDATQQWMWLEKILHHLDKLGETVYLVGHVPPGWDERQTNFAPPNHHAYSDFHNTMYLKVVQKYSHIIVGQFFGHYHSDSFRVLYDDVGKPISYLMLAPSLTPRRPHVGPNNPGLRLYKFNKDTGQIIDYTQYYLDLSSTGVYAGEWTIEYNFTNYYRINKVSPKSLHSLARKFIYHSQDRNDIFERYYKANSVKDSLHHRECGKHCQRHHYCSITNIDYTEYENCLRNATNFSLLATLLNIKLLIVNFCLVLQCLINFKV